jgi:hypothetical protein
MLERYLKTYNEQVGCANMHFNRLSYVWMVVEIPFLQLLIYQVCFINLLCKDFSVKLMHHYLEKPLFTKYCNIDL